ncbi:MAG: DUF5665 domain-containing protein [Firmicutes bacterium]|nr:DUF5665 domain-containing protein [Bacillota bacterium]
MFKKSEIIERVDKLNENLAKANLIEWSYLIGSRKEIFTRNFLAGIYRGLGIGIGVTIITAVLIYILQKVIRLNIPVIGDFISDIIDIVEQKKY